MPADPPRLLPSLAARLPGLAFTAVVGVLGAQVAWADEDATTEDDPPAPGIDWKFSTGFDYSVGDYGLEEDTELIYVPLSIQATLDRWRARISLPLLFLDGPTDLQSDGGGGERLVSRAESGLGQLIVSGSYLFGSSDTAWPYLETTVKLNAPTETDDALGAGLWAGSLQLDLFDRVGRFTPFARAGRKFYEGSRLEDRFYASVGTGFRITDRFSAGLAYDWFESTTDDVRDIHQLSPFASIRWGDFSFGPYGLLGLSQGAPDYGVGFSISVRR